MELLLTMLISILVVGIGSLFVIVKIDKMLRKQETIINEKNKLFTNMDN